MRFVFVLALSCLVGCGVPTPVVQFGTVVECKHVDAYTTPGKSSPIYVVTADGSGFFSGSNSWPTFHPARDYVVVESIGHGGVKIRTEYLTGPDFDGYKVGDKWDRLKATTRKVR